jgi:CubicO group peptidase (beta-lactamase class C family)
MTMLRRKQMIAVIPVMACTVLLMALASPAAAPAAPACPSGQVAAAGRCAAVGEAAARIDAIVREAMEDLREGSCDHTP